MPDGSVIRTAKLIAGPAAEGERRELRPGRSGCRRCLDLDPGPQMDTSPGSSSGPEPGGPVPGNAEAEPAAAAQAARAQADAAARIAHLPIPVSR